MRQQVLGRNLTNPWLTLALGWKLRGFGFVQILIVPGCETIDHGSTLRTEVFIPLFCTTNHIQCFQTEVTDDIGIALAGSEEASTLASRPDDGFGQGADVITGLRITGAKRSLSRLSALM